MGESKKVRVLIIDDDKAVRLSQLRLLERAGYDVRAAPSAFEGLDMSRDWSPDLIMLDIAMPTVSGFDALKILKTQPATRGALIVAFSAFITEDEVTRFRRIGFDDIVPKPTSADALLHRIAALIRGRQIGGSAPQAEG